MKKNNVTTNHNLLKLAFRLSKEKTVDYKLTIYETKSDKSTLLSINVDFNTSSYADPSLNKITIDTNITFQELDGFGAAMSKSSGYVISNDKQLIELDIYGKKATYSRPAKKTTTLEGVKLG